MFLFESIPLQSALMWLAVLAGLILLNELARMNKWFSLLIFLLLPLILIFTVWPRTAGEGSGTVTWFCRVQVYSALAGCLGFLALRHVHGAAKNRLFMMFPPFILVLSIMEACIRDFQSYSFNGVYDGVLTAGGPWNIINAIAGLLSIITISGCLGIYISRDKKKDMLWPDMLWFWIIAYDLWNFAYIYNCYPDHAFYTGAALLVSCTIPAFFIRKGAWLQHRVQTLAIWMMFVMCFPSFVDSSVYAVKSSHSTAALWTVSLIALFCNVAVFVCHMYRILKYRLNPLKDEVYVGLKSFRDVKYADVSSSDEVYYRFGYYETTLWNPY